LTRSAGAAMDTNPLAEEPAPAEEPALWRRFIDAGDAEARNDLIERYLPFARILAAKLYAGRRVRETEFDDYLHYAALGLIEAVDKFDPGRNVLFRTFAAHRIQGSVLNNVDRLSERDEQLALKARLRKQRLESLAEGGKDGRSTDEVFDHMAEIAIGLALGFMLEGSGMYASIEGVQAEDVYSSHELKQTRETVRALLDLLPKREKSVIRYHYYHGLGVEEIGDILGVSKGRVSQIHKQALQSLRDLYVRATEINLRL
jgi:RNA polymerase sigma factor FliA